MEIPPIHITTHLPVIGFIRMQVHEGGLNAASYEPDQGENPDRFGYVFKPVEHLWRNIGVNKKGAIIRALVIT